MTMIAHHKAIRTTVGHLIHRISQDVPLGQ